MIPNMPCCPLAAGSHHTTPKPSPYLSAGPLLCLFLKQVLPLANFAKNLSFSLSSAKEETAAVKHQSRILQDEKRKADKAIKEAADLKDELQLFKNIEFVVNESTAEVNNRMHQMCDFSKSAKDLCYVNGM